VSICLDPRHAPLRLPTTHLIHSAVVSVLQCLTVEQALRSTADTSRGEQPSTMRPTLGSRTAGRWRRKAIGKARAVTASVPLTTAATSLSHRVPSPAALRRSDSAQSVAQCLPTHPAISRYRPLARPEGGNSSCSGPAAVKSAPSPSAGPGGHLASPLGPLQSRVTADTARQCTALLNAVWIMYIRAAAAR